MFEHMMIIIAGLSQRLRRADDRGSVTLEQVVWTLLLLLAAIAAGAIVVTAITNRTDQIN